MHSVQRALMVAMVVAIAGCAAEDEIDEPACECVGDSPTGLIDLACGESACVGGTGYECVENGLAGIAPDACTCPDGDCGDEKVECVDPDCMTHPECTDLPPRDCTSGCGEMVQLSPPLTEHYDDYPINGETASDQYRSWMRRDLAMLIEHATAVVACKAADWNTGTGGPLGLGDMSEQNGAIPGESVGRPGHPPGTHTNGYDIDLAYYQIGQLDNHLRPICEHVSGGEDQYHCVSSPNILDVERTALFLGTLFESPRVRVIGVDGQAGPLLESAITSLCQKGWLAESACGGVALAYEVSDMGYGWFRFHHHHAHISLHRTGVAPVDEGLAMPCFVPGGCQDLDERGHAAPIDVLSADSEFTQ